MRGELRRLHWREFAGVSVAFKRAMRNRGEQVQPDRQFPYVPQVEREREHGIATRLFSAYSGLMSFELSEKIDLNRFIDGLNCFACASNLGDNRSLLIPVATTIFHEIGPEKRRQAVAIV